MTAVDNSACIFPRIKSRLPWVLPANPVPQAPSWTSSHLIQILPSTHAAAMLTFAHFQYGGQYLWLMAHCSAPFAFPSPLHPCSQSPNWYQLSGLMSNARPPWEVFTDSETPHGSREVFCPPLPLRELYKCRVPPLLFLCKLADTKGLVLTANEPNAL
ncbi:unnamed protein product [Gulo gulo]|uniref:Uncharacterized protein n=1 Tax=Gulo gulo TaxID=48420 RepID=A0A9X9Q8Y4_GULGU|nr:unnamed protein product [Gulo gulo]